MRTSLLFLFGLVAVLSMDTFLKSQGLIRIVLFSTFILLSMLHVFKTISFKHSSSEGNVILSRELYEATTIKIHEGATKITPIRVSISTDELQPEAQGPPMGKPHQSTSRELQQNMPTTRQLLIYMFTPDLYDWILFLAAFPLTYYFIIIPLDAPINHPSFLAFLGIMMLILYTARWGYTSVFSFLRELENEMRYFSENLESKQIGNFRVIGILVGIFFIALGIQLSHLPPSIRA